MAAVGFHDRERCADPGCLQVGRDLAHEAVDDALDEGVGDDRGAPLILAPDRADVAGERNRQVGEALGQISADGFLMAGIDVAEEQVDRDCPLLRGLAREPFVDPVAEALQLWLLQRDQDVALVIDALLDAEDMATQHAGTGFLPSRVVGLLAGDEADDGHVLHAVGPDVKNGRALLLQARVGGDGGAEHDTADLARRERALADGIERRGSGLLRRGGDLDGADAPILVVQRNEVGEGAAGVDSDPIHRSPPRRGLRLRHGPRPLPRRTPPGGAASRRHTCPRRT